MGGGKAHGPTALQGSWDFPLKRKEVSAGSISGQFQVSITSVAPWRCFLASPQLKNTLESTMG